MARPRQISDEQILEATKRRVLEDGPQVSLETVAHDLGVTAPAILKRFGSRQTLWLKALMPKDDAMAAKAVFAGPDDRPLVDQLEDLFTRMANFMGEVIPCIAALRQSGIDPHDWEPTKHQHPIRGLKAMQAWLEAAKAKGLVTIDELETAASAINGAAMSRIFLGHMFKEHWSQRAQAVHFKELATLFARALAPRQSKTPASS